MPIDREITRPMLGTDQEPTSITWKSTLRSPTASPRGPHKSRSRTRSNGAVQTSISMRSRTPSPLNKSLTQSTSNLRKSRSSKLGTSFSKSEEMKEIENDYIKNLQQQVYFLELEANYLREQAKKATEMHPQMTAEAERMLTKLRTLQSDVDGLQVEVRRKESSLELMRSEKSKVLERLTEEEREKERMKRILQEELSEVKRERDNITLENSRLDNQVERLMSEKDYGSSKLRESQNTISILREQLSEKVEQHKLMQITVEEKRAQCMDAEARAERVEEHYLNTVQRAHERQINEYKDGTRVVKQQLKEQERQAHDDRYLKNKTQDDNEQLSKTNFILKSQIEDLEMQVVKEQQLRSELDNNRTEDLVEISIMSDREKELKLELRSAQQELIGERERCDRYLQQLKRQEDVSTNLESTNNSVKMTLAECEARVSILEKEGANLRRDKEILTDHVADVQRQLAHKGAELSQSKLQVRELVNDLSLAETEKIVEETTQSEKWREFESLAEGMKKLSRTMARTTSPTKSPRSSVQFT